MEFIDVTEVSPLISKCTIKVCYVGQQPNRNGSIITKEVASELGKKLPGSPIVGYYDKEQKDFQEHNRELNVDEDGNFELIDTTKPYGFIDTGAKVWFQKFVDDGVEHEYLVTEGYLWTSAYPECQRILTQGNNQSMELDKKNTTGTWTTDNNSNKRIFIINDGLIEKLCILGENYEPCFEGAQIQKSFSLEEDMNEFKTTLFSMIQELKEALNKGGSNQVMNNKEIQETETEFKKDSEDKKEEEQQKESEVKSNEDKEEDKKKKPPMNNACGDDKKKKYNLEEVVEYTELKKQYDELQQKFTTLETENAGLREFRTNAERKEKQDMIDSFYMLSDEDKKDVVANIDNYSLDDIEGKLSIICVRNKINLSEKNEEESPTTNFTLDLDSNMNNDTTPAWIKAVIQNQKEDI